MNLRNLNFSKKLTRFNIPWHARELTFSCYKRFPYFDDTIACFIFLDLLQLARIKYGFELWAYVIMLNHIHLLIYPGEKGTVVPEILHSLKGKTGRQYKNHIVENVPETLDAFCIMKRGVMKFQFWQPGGGYDRNLWSAKAIHSAIEYIENNPVRAGLVSSPDQWRWSSAWTRKHQCGLIPDEINIPVLMK